MIECVCVCVFCGIVALSARLAWSVCMWCGACTCVVVRSLVLVACVGVGSREEMTGEGVHRLVIREGVHRLVSFGGN